MFIKINVSFINSLFISWSNYVSVVKDGVWFTSSIQGLCFLSINISNLIFNNL